MKISDLDETRVIAARDRAKKFFDMLSDRKRKAKADKEREVKSQEFQQEIELRRQSVLQASPPPPRKTLASEHTKPQPHPVEPDAATQAFLRWCFRGEEDDDEPYWVKRNPRLYGGSH